MVRGQGGAKQASLEVVAHELALANHLAAIHQANLPGPAAVEVQGLDLHPTKHLAAAPRLDLVAVVADHSPNPEEVDLNPDPEPSQVDLGLWHQPLKMVASVVVSGHVSCSRQNPHGF